MQKKLIAVAVGGALGAIGAAPALAQNATVNVFGTFYGEYSRINNGDKSPGEKYQSYDHFQNPGSEIGFRGEEKLGGGLSAWFQCTASTDYRGNGNASATNAQAGSAWCNRNSALGLKGGFGNLFFGNWNTPFTRINAAGNIGSNDTGVFGNAHIITGTSSTFGISSPQQTNNVGGAASRAAGQTAVVGAVATSAANPTGTAALAVSATAPINTISPGAFRRRQNNLFTYETPNFGGFTAMGSITTRNNASAATANQLKTRLWSLGAQYANGPIFVGAAYEKHSDFIIRPPSTAAAPNGGDVNGWTVAASYTLPINLKLGGSFSGFKSQSTAAADAKVKSLHFGIDWMISGPHGVRAGYSHAFNVKGPTGTGFNTRPDAAPNTSASMYQIRYVYALSKRTEVTAGLSRTVNKANANYETGGSTTSQLPGSDSSAIAVAVRHTF